MKKRKIWHRFNIIASLPAFPSSFIPVLGIKPRALCMPGRSFANEPQSSSVILEQGNQKQECAEGGAVYQEVSGLYTLWTVTQNPPRM